MREKIRGLDEMPWETKLNYCKILSLMVTIDGQVEQLKMVELYRLIAKVMLGDSKRPKLLEFIFEPKIELEDLWEKILEGLNNQEKNILRFSIIKDLLIIMRADYYEALEEIKFLEKTKEMLHISEEHMKFFEEEYQNDKNFFHYFIPTSKGSGLFIIKFCK